MSSDTPTFPANFLWGAATAAFQIEGATRTDGRGLSIWDVFCTRPDRIQGRQHADIACDHYHLWREDIALMRDLGLNSYRFSISWSRVLPNGRGPINRPGLDFYEQLVDGLIEAGIQPLVTLYHWDLPHALYCEGGWLNRATCEAFGDYAALIAQKLGDRVSHWCTINEIANAGALGHHLGIHAPGVSYSDLDYFRVVHHLNLAHARGLAALRAQSPRPCRIGQAFNQNVNLPVSASPEDVEAARKDMFGFSIEQPWWSAQLWIEPLFNNRYSPEVEAFYSDALSVIQPGDLEAMNAPMDYLGWNYYCDWTKTQKAAGEPTTHLRWTVQPGGIYWGARFLHERYKLPIQILENGLASMDWVATDGTVPDAMRIDHLRIHLRELARAGAEGVPLEGYYHWSFLDNFEWAEGYLPRFGLVHVDYPTLKRTPKASFAWYRDVIRANGANL